MSKSRSDSWSRHRRIVLTRASFGVFFAGSTVSDCEIFIHRIRGRTVRRHSAQLPARSTIPPVLAAGPIWRDRSLSLGFGEASPAPHLRDLSIRISSRNASRRNFPLIDSVPGARPAMLSTCSYASTGFSAPSPIRLLCWSSYMAALSSRQGKYSNTYGSKTVFRNSSNPSFEFKRKWRGSALGWPTCRASRQLCQRSPSLSRR